MTNDDKETTTAGSEGIPQRGSDGIAGTSREESKCEHRPSGADSAGRENEELEWARRHVKGIRAVGEEPGWIVVKRSKSHFCTIRVRSRPAKREFSRRAAALAGRTA